MRICGIMQITTCNMAQNPLHPPTAHLLGTDGGTYDMKRTLDWNQYLARAAEAVAEGIVMLKNDNGALPLPAGEEIALFGRIQLHYYKSGTGSGGMVNVSKVTGIPEGLQEAGVRLYQPLLDVYREWDKAHPYDLGEGWGGEPWSQTEMPLDEALVQQCAAACSRAPG